MLAYRHAFHAGNHADVLKHLVLYQVLDHMNQKDKGWRYVDTHAGAGGYSLQGDYARKKAEYEQGVGRLLARITLALGMAPAFLLAPGELLAFAEDYRLTVLGYFSGEVAQPKRAVIQRLAARAAG